MEATSTQNRELKARKVAISFGYVGTDYRGLQISYGENAPPTIERELRRALAKV